MKFTKMHGLGNDFVMVDCLREQLSEESLSELARAVCDRHFGVGADGLIMALPSEVADFRMRLINADGSEAEHCGNGIRCLAKLVYDLGHTSETQITVETTGRVNVLRLFLSDGVVDSVCVDMGRPEMTRGAIGMIGDPNAEVVGEVLDVGGRRMSFTGVSMGNPHLVTFVDDTATAPVTTLGPVVENHAALPRRTNVEFVQVLAPDELNMRVWERGAGETLACGTGTCASLVAAHRNGLTGRRAVVHLLGGDLLIEWKDDDRVYMTGPAVTVYEGDTVG